MPNRWKAALTMGALTVAVALALGDHVAPSTRTSGLLPAYLPDAVAVGMLVVWVVIGTTLLMSSGRGIVARAAGFLALQTCVALTGAWLLLHHAPLTRDGGGATLLLAVTATYLLVVRLIEAASLSLSRRSASLA